LPVPDLVACAGQVGQSPAFILSRAVEGSPIFAAGVTDEMVCQLAKQVATLHSFSQSTWGKLSQPSKQAKQWQEKLSQTLQLTTCMQGQEAWIYQAMTEIEQLNTETFAPVMLDNRWDQYLSKHGRMTALVDLDAFVIAPPELELVLLEYQLNDKQASLFKKEYEQLRPFPDLSQQRIAYRLLLFLMNAMGETNIERSMQAKTHW